MGDVLLEAGELDEVPIGLLAEVETVRVDDELEAPRRRPEVEHADTRDVRRVVQRLEGRDRGGSRRRVGTEPFDDPRELVATAALVVEQPSRIASCVPELGNVLEAEEVLVHPARPGRVAETRD